MQTLDKKGQARMVSYVNPLPVDLQAAPTLTVTEVPLVPTVARQLDVGLASANTVLTSTCKRISVRSTVEARFSIGSTAQTASSTSHYIAAGERLEFNVPATPNIAVIAASTAGKLELTELE